MFAVRCPVIAAAVVCTALATPLRAQDSSTRILVRVTAHDAKIIGSNVGGARVTVRNAETGEVLAQGEQQGSTGDTRRIMIEPRERGGMVYDTEGAAGFLAELNIDRPTMVEITAEGPLGIPHAVQRASTTMLAVPGHDVLGDGVILELLGFTVVLESPADGEALVAGEEFEIRATVTMLCGCPTSPGGLWDADDIDVVARLVRDGSLVAEVPLAFAGATSTFSATTSVAEAGSIEILVVASDPGKGNFGLASGEAVLR